MYSFSNSDEKYIFQALLKVDIDLRPADGGKKEYGRLHRMGYMVHHRLLLSDKTLPYRDERKALGQGGQGWWLGGVSHLPYRLSPDHSFLQPANFLKPESDCANPLLKHCISCLLPSQKGRTFYT